MVKFSRFTPARLIKGRTTKQKLALAGIALLLFSGAIASVLYLLESRPALTPGGVSRTEKYPTQTIDLEELLSPSQIKQTQQSLTINAQLQVSGGVIFSPISQPARGVTGQVYFDKDTSTLGYYDGEKFVSLASSADIATLSQQVEALKISLNTLQGQVPAEQSVTNVTNLTSVTNVTNLTDCSQCVKLQGENPEEQIGNVRIGGNLSSHKISIQSPFVDTEAFTIATPTGEKLLSADTLNQKIEVGDLLPQRSSTGSVGENTPGYIQDNRRQSVITNTATGYYGGYGKISTQDNESLLRLAYDNGYGIAYTRCNDDDCTQPTTKLIAEHDGDTILLSPAITLDANGIPYISYLRANLADDFDEEANVYFASLVLARCSDADCTSVDYRDVATRVGLYNTPFGLDMTLDQQGRPTLAYIDQALSENGFHDVVVVDCADASCASKQSYVAHSTLIPYVPVDLEVSQNGAVFVGYTAITSEDVGVFAALIRCSDGECASSSLPSNGYVEPGSAVTVALGSDDMPRLAYTHIVGGTQNLRFMRCTDAQCGGGVHTDIASGTYMMPGDIMLSASGVPTIGYITGWSWSSLQAHVRTCVDASCRDGTSYLAVASAQTYSKTTPYTGSDGQLRILHNSDQNRNLVIVQDVVPTYVLPVTKYPVDNYGTNIGSADDRFGQLFAASLDLQSYGSSAALVVNGMGGYDPAVLASFRVEGVELVNIDGAGRLNVGATGSVAQPGASVNLMGGSDDTDLLHAYNKDGEATLRITSDGDIVAGRSTALCDGCLPTMVANSIDIGKQGISQLTAAGRYIYAATDYERAGVGSDSGGGGVSDALVTIDTKDRFKPAVTSGGAYGQSAYGRFITHNGYGYLPILGPGNEIFTFSMADPSKPRFLSRVAVTLPSIDIFGMQAKGDHLYVVGRYGLYVFSLANPSTPEQIAFLKLGQYEQGSNEIIIIGNTALIRNDGSNNEVYSVDISNPSTPVLVNTLKLYSSTDSTKANDMVLKGDVLYVPCNSTSSTYCRDASYGAFGFVMLDVANPRAPSIMGGVKVPYITAPSDIHLQVRGNYLYMSGDKALRVFDISNPRQPVYKDQYLHTSHIGPFVVMDNVVYVTHGKSGKIDVLASMSESSFQGLTSEVLNVQQSAAIQGTLNVTGESTFTQVASVAGGANLIVKGMSAPISASPTIYSGLGSIPYSPDTVRHYKVTAFGPNGESAPVSKTIAASAFPKASVPSNLDLLSPQIDTTATGDLTGTFKYRFTVSTRHGETPVGSYNPTVTVSGKQITFSSLYNYMFDEGTLNVYRCTMPACSSYRLVAEVPAAKNTAVHSFTDNNPSPSTKTPPTVNTAYTDSNYGSVYIKPPEDAKGVITGYRLYRSTDGINYEYTDASIPSTENSYVYLYDYGDESRGVTWTSGQPPEIGAGRLGIGTDAPRASLDVVGNVLMQSGVDSVSALRVQGSAGGDVLVVDTLNGRVGVGTATPSAALHISGLGTKQALVRITDTTPGAWQDVLEIGNAGVLTIRNRVDSQSAVRIQSAAGVAIFTVDTVNSRVVIAPGANLFLSGTAAQRNAITAPYTCSATEAVYDIVAVTGAETVGRTTSVGNNRVAGVVVAKPDATTCIIAVAGAAKVNFGSNPTPNPVGQPVTTSSVAGMAQATSTPPEGSVVGVSMSAKDASNLVWVLLR